MPKLSPKDEETLERFYHFLQPELAEGTANDYRSHIRAVVHDSCFMSLDELNGHLDDAIFTFDRTRYKKALIKYQDFIESASPSNWRPRPISVAPIIDRSSIIRDSGDGVLTQPEVMRDLEEELRKYMIFLADFAYELVEGHRPNVEENWPRVEIRFERRKKTETPWLLEVLDFMKKNIQRRYADELKVFKRNIAKCIEADDDYDGFNWLGRFVDRILLLIIGEHHASNDAVCKQAQEYLDQLRSGKVHLLKVLLGEYIDHLFNGNKLIREPDPSVIVLYLSNIRDYASRNNLNTKDCQKATFAHEFFHFYHYFNVWTELLNANVDRLTHWFRKYDPGTIVKESFADYFKHAVLLRENKLDHAKLVEKAWKENDVAYWPYSGATRICDDDRFKDLFADSTRILTSYPRVLGVIAEILKLPL